MQGISILYDKQLLNYNIHEYVKWDPKKTPHGIIIGATGSGKTYFSKLLLGKIIKSLSNSKIYICDFKGDDDFSFLAGGERFYRYHDCQRGFDQFYKEFKMRQAGEDLTRNEKFLYFDEYASYINSLEKKRAEEEKLKMSNLLMMARSYNVHVLVATQRGDAQYFLTARDNLSLVIALGTISEESCGMFFATFKKLIKPQGLGTGYVLMNGNMFKEIKVPTINNNDKLEEAIKLGVTR